MWNSPASQILKEHEQVDKKNDGERAIPIGARKGDSDSIVEGSGRVLRARVVGLVERRGWVVDKVEERGRHEAVGAAAIVVLVKVRVE